MNLNEFRTPTRKIDASSMRIILHKQIYTYEHRYEVPSTQMAQMINSGDARETAEILQWMQDYHALQLLDRTLTDGIPMNSIE